MITRSDAPETIAMRERLLPEHGTMSELHFPLGYYEGTCLEVNPAAVRRSVWAGALQCAQRKTTSAFPQESADVVFLLEVSLSKAGPARYCAVGENLPGAFAPLFLRFVCGCLRFGVFRRAGVAAARPHLAEQTVDVLFNVL